MDPGSYTRQRRFGEHHDNQQQTKSPSTFLAIKHNTG